MIHWLLTNKNLFHNIKKSIIKIPFGGRIELNPSDFVDRYIYVTGKYEEDMANHINLILKNNDNFIDVGANIGYFSLIASKLVGPKGLVFAFEASPKMLLRLENNISLNNLTNIIVYPNAISNAVSMVEFVTYNESNSGMSSLRKIEGFSSIEVKAITLDSIIDSLPQIKLIKMDIEGAEGLALQGMVALLKRDRPIILLELTDNYLKQLNSSALEIIQKLINLNYKISTLNGELINSTNVPLEQCNILCKPFISQCVKSELT